MQIILALRVVLRLIKTAGGEKIKATSAPHPERVSVIVPVLNETARIKTCLECLIAQSETVAEILMVDGGPPMAPSPWSRAINRATDAYD